jgi:hypothetical protein
MAKPSRKKASNRTRKPKSAVAQKPEPTVEELKADVAKFDHDGDGHPGGSLPEAGAADGSETNPPVNDAEQPQEDEGETTEGESDPDPVPDEVEPETTPPEAPEPAARSQTVSLGSVQCRLRRVAVDAVLGLLSPDGLRRVEAEKETGSFESVRQRLLATDGLATPVVFEAGARGGDEPTILHGFAELAAAQVCGVPDVPVILVPPGGASEAQAHIVEMVRQQRMGKDTPDDDELFYRVHAED